MLDDSQGGVAVQEPRAASDPMRAQPDDLGFHPQLAKTIFDLLNWVDLGNPALEAELEKLEAEFRNAVYAELIFLLSHLRFPGEVARRHWFNVIDHQKRMSARLDAAVDLRVALVSYFLEVNRSFKNPKLIELRVFEQTRASAYWDELTGLRNYRFFSEHLNHELLRSHVTGAPLSLVMIDVDDFKSFNDGYGHEAGNEALVHIAKLIARSVRPADVVARYGGEEFALVLAATPKHEAQRVAEEVRRAVADHEPLRDDRSLTLSLGVATSPADAGSVGALVRHADSALYAAKFGGKNQVRMFRESTRSYTRVETALRGTFTMQSLDWTPMSTVKISEGGLQFFSRHNLAEKSLLEFHLELPGDAQHVIAVGRVVRVDRSPAGFQVAVQFVELPAHDRERLTNHLQAREQGVLPDPRV